MTASASAPKLPRLSASKLKVYEQCPTQYKWKYILGHKDHANIYGVLGSAVHKAIQDKYIYPDTDIIYLFQQAYARWVTPDVDQFYKARELYIQACEWLESFDFEYYTPFRDDTKPVLEKHFRLPYSIDNVPVCTLEGYIDFIGTVNNGETLFVVDWKTGREVYSNKKVEKDIQFIIYDWAIEQLYGKKPEYIIYHRLRNHKRYSGSTFNRSQLNDLILKLLSDPMEYEPTICENTCPFYCGVRKYFTQHIMESEIESGG